MQDRTASEMALLDKRMKDMLAEGKTKRDIYKKFRKDGYTYVTIQKYYYMNEGTEKNPVIQENTKLKEKLAQISREIDADGDIGST